VIVSTVISYYDRRCHSNATFSLSDADMGERRRQLANTIASSKSIRNQNNHEIPLGAHF